MIFVVVEDRMPIMLKVMNILYHQFCCWCSWKLLSNAWSLTKLDESFWIPSRTECNAIENEPYPIHVPFNHVLASSGVSPVLIAIVRIVYRDPLILKSQHIYIYIYISQLCNLLYMLTRDLTSKHMLTKCFGTLFEDFKW
jgi:hypothetical protein